MDRREAIRRVGELMGGVALIGSSALWTACQTKAASHSGAIRAFSPSDIAFLDEVAETILPETSTPGAKDAHVGAFMALMVTDAYDAGDQQVFRQGMTQLDTASRAASGRSFLDVTAESRLAVLQRLDQEQRMYMEAKTAAEPNHYFRMMKELTLLGYFTSEIGCTRAQRYVESPGRYEPCQAFVVGHRPGRRTDSARA